MFCLYLYTEKTEKIKGKVPIMILLFKDKRENIPDGSPCVAALQLHLSIQ